MLLYQFSVQWELVHQLVH